MTLASTPPRAQEPEQQLTTAETAGVAEVTEVAEAQAASENVPFPNLTKVAGARLLRHLAEATDGVCEGSLHSGRTYSWVAKNDVSYSDWAITSVAKGSGSDWVGGLARYVKAMRAEEAALVGLPAYLKWRQNPAGYVWP